MKAKQYGNRQDTETAHYNTANSEGRQKQYWCRNKCYPMYPMQSWFDNKHPSNMGKKVLVDLFPYDPNMKSTVVTICNQKDHKVLQKPKTWSKLKENLSEAHCD